MSKSRSYFNPCEYLGLVYLCGYRSVMVETFNPESGTFQTSLDTVGERSPSLLYVDDEELVILSANWVSHWRYDMVKVKETQHPSCVVDSNMAPVVDSVNGVVYVACNGVCTAIKTGSFTRIEIA